MKELKARYEVNSCVVHDGGEAIGEIVYENNKHIIATMFVGGKSYKIEPESATEKNIVIREDGSTIVKFDFDYLWGNATLLFENEETGYEIKGKFLKSGTRLVDSDNNDLVVVTTAETTVSAVDYDIVVNDEEVNNFLILATLHYHNYTSASKLLSVLMANAVGGAL